jgi:hypothetical protein
MKQPTETATRLRPRPRPTVARPTATNRDHPPVGVVSVAVRQHQTGTGFGRRSHTTVLTEMSDRTVHVYLRGLLRTWGVVFVERVFGRGRVG